MPLEANLVDQVWGKDRDPKPANPVIRLDDEYAGESVGAKLKRLREKLKETGSPGIVVSQLDEVAWMFNLRGSDIPFNPVSEAPISRSSRITARSGKAHADGFQVFFAYAILTAEDCNLFINPTCLSDSIKDYLHTNGVAILEYEQIWSSLKSLGDRTKVYRENKAKEEEPKGSSGPKEITLADGDKVVLTDKVLVGKKTSWAVVRMLEEVSNRQRGQRMLIMI